MIRTPAFDRDNGKPHIYMSEGKWYAIIKRGHLYHRNPAWALFVIAAGWCKDRV